MKDFNVVPHRLVGTVLPAPPVEFSFAFPFTTGAVPEMSIQIRYEEVVGALDGGDVVGEMQVLDDFAEVC